MCTTITLDESTIDVIISAITDKMGDINTCSILSGVVNEKMKRNYAECEKALDLFNKAKDSFKSAKAMVGK